jgi:hypothetical protein
VACNDQKDVGVLPITARVEALQVSGGARQVRTASPYASRRTERRFGLRRRSGERRPTLRPSLRESPGGERLTSGICNRRLSNTTWRTQIVERAHRS